MLTTNVACCNSLLFKSAPAVLSFLNTTPDGALLCFCRCTIGVFVNKICYITGGVGQFNKPFIQTMVIGYTGACLELEAVYCHMFCIPMHQKVSRILILQLFGFAWPDGSYYAAGCGKQSQSNSFVNCPSGMLICIDIDVQGGEVVSGQNAATECLGFVSIAHACRT